MAVDNTHTKYLKGADKKTWSSYKDAIEAQQNLENFFESLNAPKLKAGEEYDIPVYRKKKDNK